MGCQFCRRAVRAGLQSARRRRFTDSQDVDLEDAAVCHVGVPGPLAGSRPNGGLYETADAGRSWTKTLFTNDEIGTTDVMIDPSDRRTLIAVASSRSQVNVPGLPPSWFGEIKIDPRDEQRLYFLRERLYISEDGGHTFRIKGGPAFGPGVRTMWINPLNPDHLMIATGAWPPHLL